MNEPLKACAHCGKAVHLDPSLPLAEISWCSPECSDAWFAARPEEAAKWTAVGDLSSSQRAELDAILGLGAKA
jgi:hypothetical protein